MILTFKANKETTIRKLLIESGVSKDATSAILAKKSNVKINGEEYKIQYKLESGDEVHITLENEKSSVKPIDKEIEIIYEDDYILVVNKPKGLATIPTIARYDDNLAARVKNYFIKTKQSEGIHVINRLDVETQGIVIFAKNRIVQHSITNINKEYEGIVQGHIEKEGIVEAPILKIEGEKKHIICDEGKYAKTGYIPLEYIDINTKVKFILYTGRTHQIRIHMAYIGHPLVGDNLYGDTNGEYYLKCCHMSLHISFLNKNYIFSI